MPNNTTTNQNMEQNRPMPRRNRTPFFRNHHLQLPNTNMHKLHIHNMGSLHTKRNTIKKRAKLHSQRMPGRKPNNNSNMQLYSTLHRKQLDLKHKPNNMPKFKTTNKNMDKNRKLPKRSNTPFFRNHHLQLPNLQQQRILRLFTRRNSS